MELPSLPLRTFTDEQLLERRKYLGASEAHYIMDGKWTELWQVKTGRAPSPDLSDELAPQMGLWTEAFNLAWCAKHTKWDLKVAPSFKPVDFMSCSPDAITSAPALINAKHTNQWSTKEQLYARYAPQMHHEMIVTGIRLSYISVFYGNAKWELIEIPYDVGFAARYRDMAKTFWQHVIEDRAPESDLEPALPPTPPDQWRTLDMTGNNAWADSAALWLENKAAAKVFKDAESALKGLVPEDVGDAFGHGIQIKRATNKALKISVFKAPKKAKAA